MTWRPHGRAGGTNPHDLQGASWASCDHCGFNFKLRDLTWQLEWAGTSLINKHLLVCSRCLDIPNPQLKTPILPIDPAPIMNARPEPYSIDELGGYARAYPTADTTQADASATIATADQIPLSPPPPNS